MIRAVLARAAAVTATVASAAPAAAADLFGGVYAHDVGLFTKTIHESGADVELGYRFDPVPFLGLQPYLLGSVNSHLDTDFVAAGVSRRFGSRVYLRPGFAVAVHDGRIRRYVGDERVDLGSRVLFEPELALGVQVAPRIGIEASYTHLSHAQIFSHQNPGEDMLGVRVNLHLP